MTDEIRELLTCPISHDIMSHSVTLMQSGMQPLIENTCEKLLACQESNVMSCDERGLGEKLLCVDRLLLGIV